MLFLIQRLKLCAASIRRQLPLINQGGCAVYASQVAAALARAGIPVWGVVMGPQGLNLDKVRLNSYPTKVEHWNRQGVFFSHVLIQFTHASRTWTHDVNHTMTDFEKRYPIMPGTLSVQELKLLAADHEGWNPTFNRACGIPSIRERVHRYLTP